MAVISLVVATFGRQDELVRLFDSLTCQTAMNFEVIVADQNEDDRVRRVLAAELPFPVIYLQSVKGASRARNRGAASATGEIVGFPDDDCWYPSNTTRHLAQSMNADKADLLSGKIVDPLRGTGIYHFPDQSVRIGLETLRTCVSASGLFIRREAFERVGGFIEDLGPGTTTVWGAMEELDLVARCLKLGLRCEYDGNLIVHHPAIANSITPAKARAYGGGLGYIDAVHPGAAGNLPIALARSFCGFLYRSATFRPGAAAINVAALYGRLNGYLKARRYMSRADG